MSVHVASLLAMAGSAVALTCVAPPLLPPLLPLLLLAAVWCSAYGAGRECGTPWTDCGSTSVSLDSFVLEGCCSPPCRLTKGANISLAIAFTATETTGQWLEQSLCGETEYGECVSLPLSPSSEGPLRLEARMKYSVTATLPVSQAYPTISLAVYWRLLAGPFRQSVGCVRLPVLITAGSSRRPQYTPEARLHAPSPFLPIPRQTPTAPPPTGPAL